LKELLKRISVALWGVPFILGLSYLGSYYFLALILIINGMSLWEYYTIFRKKDLQAYRFLAVISSSILIISAYWLDIQILFSMFLIISIIVLLRHLKVTDAKTSINTSFTLSGIFYITLFLIALLKLRLNFSSWVGQAPGSNIGGKFMVFIWISIWICDTFAYFGGSLLGYHKLAPKTSPNKTIEGAIFGFIGAVIVFVLLSQFINLNIPTLHLWFSAIIVGIFGQLGDLVESRFKRDAGVKDTSSLLPGHGGFFDRFDSLIFVSPFFFLLFYFLRP